MTEKRFEQAQLAAWTGIIGNLLLALMKGVVGMMAGSKALIADAANSASDVVGSIAVLIGIRAAKLPPDRDHPYGHGKAESIAAIIVSVLLMLVGLEIGIASIKTIYNGVDSAPKWYALIAIGISVVVKELLFQYNFRMGKKLSSQALIANAWDHRSDVYSSLAALVGIGGAVAGQYLNIPQLYLLDPVAGVIVALIVLRMGYKLVRDSIHSTMDHVLHDEDSEELIKAVQDVKGVITVDSLRAREHGHYVIVDAKISVNPHISVMEGHDIARSVKYQLMQQFSHVSDVFIHVNPYDPGFPYKSGPAPQASDSPVLH
ncbi:cation diffusion facilitator family transporter [Paenibacillus sp. y28]|uniref:cation diffusion facilitator family transporter n=1 Tax=Paenibacillus sp. y28 TaxID=3129110 RepID=UPI00301A8E31